MQPIPDERALIHDDMLVIADLHIGYEIELREKGINIPSQTQKRIKKLLELVKKFRPKRLLVIGDLKHTISFSTTFEKIELGAFISELKNKVHIEIVKGNHDGNLDYLEVPVYPPSGVKIRDIGLFHGSSWPDEELLDCRYLVMGHIHPMVVLEDKLKHRVSLPCWLRAKFDRKKTEEKYGRRFDGELVVMPAFSELLGGIAVNTGKLVDPVFKLINPDKSDVYLLDGTHLGKVEDLKLKH